MLYFSNSKFNISFTITEDIYTLSYRSHISTNSCASRLEPELFQPTSPFLSIRTLARESSLLFPARPGPREGGCSSEGSSDSRYDL